MLSRLPASRRLPALALAGGLAAALAVSAVLAGQESATSAGPDPEQIEARAELAQDLGELRRSLTAPAHEARDAAAALRLNVAETVKGSDRDLGAVREDRERLVAALRDAADELEANGDDTELELHDALATEVVEPVEARLDGLDEQASWVAEQLHATADEVEAWAGTADELRAATDDLVSRDLPGTDDPDELAARWREELEDLEDHRAAAEEAAEHDALGAVGEAHLTLVAGLEELAVDAVDHLEDGDVDAYNALLEERLGDEDPFGFSEAMADAIEPTLARGPLAEIEESSERTLGLLTELERLRRAAPARSSL